MQIAVIITLAQSVHCPCSCH